MPARISFYRPTGQSRRQARSHHDHDVFEGLPVRRWVRRWVPYGRKTITQTPQLDLPLPKETHLLSPMNQALLQAARAGSLDKPKPQQPSSSSITQQQQQQQKEALFTTKKWTLTPKHQVLPEPIYLAKLPDVPKRKKRIKKKVNGKIMITYVEEQQQQIGHAVVQSQQQAPPPPRRRAPPKRKPGRGRKPGRKVKFVDESAVAAARATAIASSQNAGVATLAAAGGGIQVKDVEMIDQDKASRYESVTDISQRGPTTAA